MPRTLNTHLSLPYITFRFHSIHFLSFCTEHLHSSIILFFFIFLLVLLFHSIYVTLPKQSKGEAESASQILSFQIPIPLTFLSQLLLLGSNPFSSTFAPPHSSHLHLFLLSLVFPSSPPSPFSSSPSPFFPSPPSQVRALLRSLLFTPSHLSSHHPLSLPPLPIPPSLPPHLYPTHFSPPSPLPHPFLPRLPTPLLPSNH